MKNSILFILSLTLVLSTVSLYSYSSEPCDKIADGDLSIKSKTVESVDTEVLGLEN